MYSVVTTSFPVQTNPQQYYILSDDGINGDIVTLPSTAVSGTWVGVTNAERYPVYVSSFSGSANVFYAGNLSNRVTLPSYSASKYIYNGTNWYLGV